MKDDPRRPFESFSLGETFDLGEITLSEDDITGFARAYDPQPFHLDHAAASASPLGGLAASGWHSCAVSMRLFFEGFIRQARGLGGPGIPEARWLQPIRAGAPITGRAVVSEMKPSRSRPGMGVMVLDVALSQNERDALIETFPVLVAMESLDAPLPPLPPADPQPMPDAAAPDTAFTFARAAEVPIGTRVDLGEAQFEPDAIKRFAAAFDPQAFHLDEDAGRESVFGGLAASGWHTVALWMLRLVTTRDAVVADAAPERQTALRAAFGPSPGFRNLVWRRPVLAGDAVRYYTTATGLRAMARHPDWALMTSRNEAYNRDGALVMAFDGATMIRR